MEWIETLVLIKPNELILPTADSASILELSIHHGFTYTIGSFELCLILFLSQKKIKMHLNKVHSWK